MNIPVTFAHDDSVRFVDPEVAEFLRATLMRGGNIQTRTLRPVVRRALALAHDGVPCLADWRQALAEVGPTPVGVKGYGVRA